MKPKVCDLYASGSWIRSMARRLAMFKCMSMLTHCLVFGENLKIDLTII